MATSTGLLASSATLEGLAALVQRYCISDSAPTLNDDGTITLPSGRLLPGVRWVKKRQRYRFEMIPD